MKATLAFFLIVGLLGCEGTYTTTTLCLDADLNVMIRDEHVHLRDIYDEEDSCEEAGGTWYWQCKETGALHAIPDSEFPLYNQRESIQDVCPR